MSQFDVYLNGKRIEECNELNTTRSFLSKFNTVNFINVKYANKICPLVFQHTDIVSINFRDITNTLLIMNRLSFTPLNKTDLVILPNIFMLFLEMHNEKLSESIMNAQLFKKVKYISILGSVSSIDTYVLKEFTSLLSIFLTLYNFRELFHNTNTLWMNSLNERLHINMNNSMQVSQYADKYVNIDLAYPPSNLVVFEKVYDFPDEDFCLFKRFPHDQLVLPHIYAPRNLNCSCTLQWLHLYYNVYGKYYEINTYITYDVYKSYTNPSEIKHGSVWAYCEKEFATLKCDIATRLEKCNLPLTLEKILASNGNSNHSFHIHYDVELYFLLKWFEYVLLLHVKPVLSALSLLCNLMIIVVIRNKNKAKKLFKDIMYKFILINAAFNIFYSCVNLLSLISLCVITYMPKMCSSVYMWESIQYFKIVVVFFLGNVLKTCSNITYLFFVFSRLSSVSVKKNRLLYRTLHPVHLKIYAIVV